MGSGRYDHPAFLVPQWQHFGKTTAGASGTSIRHTPPFAIRVKSVTAGVATAGTTTGAASGIVIQQDGTAKGTISLSTNVAGVFGTLGNLDFTVPQGGTLAFVGGADATLVADISMEFKIDPAATWTGNT